jgi:putative transposase
MSLKYWTGAHTKHRLMFHIIWIPKYRKRILKGKVAKRLKQILYNTTQINQWWIEELEILDDHVHILIQIQPPVKIKYRDK